MVGPGGGSRSRGKGQVGEREFATELSWVLNCDAHRGRQYHGGQDAPDVKTDLLGIHFEVKRCEALSLYPAMAQAEEDASGDVPVVAHQKNRREWLLVVKLNDLPRLVEKLNEHRGKQDVGTPEVGGLPMP